MPSGVQYWPRSEPSDLTLPHQHGAHCSTTGSSFWVPCHSGTERVAHQLFVGGEAEQTPSIFVSGLRICVKSLDALLGPWRSWSRSKGFCRKCAAYYRVWKAFNDKIIHGVCLSLCFGILLPFLSIACFSEGPTFINVKCLLTFCTSFTLYSLMKGMHFRYWLPYVIYPCCVPYLLNAVYWWFDVWFFWRQAHNFFENMAPVFGKNKTCFVLKVAWNNYDLMKS